jgi:hypothetical protein
VNANAFVQVLTNEDCAAVRAGPNQVAFHTGPGCVASGVSTYWTRGSYDVNTPFFADNDVSSIDLPWGTTVVLYDGPGFSGQKIVLRRSSLHEPEECLAEFGFDDMASSFRVSDGACTHVLGMCMQAEG